ncbi:uncharacterized protein LOC113523749 [Pangasianodon hypophthalmus]|uniref:uncharacterized protein LOC113523749 n=1 Tax=Pangasianodon hypophthalmus TaxID=310915 RepID=UPI000EFEF454|nr:uncharacterized protein LOC113523749 [Pangasianodon hypophthalmus]
MRTQRQSSPKLLSKRKCRPNPKFVEEETSNDGPSSPKKKCQNSSVQCASWGNGLKQRSRAHRNNWHHLPPYRKLLKFTKAQEFVCQKNVFWSASHANSPTTMARMLLLGVFDIETLLKSNLRGGKSKNANPGETNVAMDRAKINAIISMYITWLIGLIFFYNCVKPNVTVKPSEFISFILVYQCDDTLHLVLNNAYISETCSLST